MTYQEKVSFDGKIWHQLQWSNIEFKDFGKTSTKCNSIEELKSKILEVFPECQLKCEYIGEWKLAPIKEAKKTKKKK